MIETRKNRYKIDRSSLGLLDENILEKIRRCERDFLKPYFNYGRDVFLETLDILYKDVNSDFTIFIAKPGQFKTDKQKEENGLNYSPLKNKDFKVSDYLTNKNNLDLVGIIIRPILYNKDHFDLLYRFYYDYFDKLKFNYSKDKE